MKVPFFAAKNGSWIRSTPATDGERVYVAGMLGRLVCLDNETGKIIWQVDFSEKYGTQREDFGQVCSPLIIEPDAAKDNSIYIQCSAGFLKLNRLTGEEIWRTLDSGGGMMSGGAFSSPYVATVAGKKQILVQTREELAGVDMASGKVLWRQPVPNFRGMNILTPTTFRDTVFTSSYNNLSFGYQISANGDQFSVEESWTAPSKAYMSSPVIIGGHAYMHLQSKRLACLDLATGETSWISKQRFGEYWSMVATDDKILALDSRGVLYLLKANPEKLEILGEVDLATDDSWAHLAVVGDRVFVRGINSMAVYQWQSQTSR
jgi:outer membrane protein assembly factor BamB